MAPNPAPTRIRSAPVVVEDDFFVPPEENLHLVYAPVTYKNMAVQPLMGDIVVNDHGDEFIVLCRSRLDPSHYLNALHDVTDYPLGVIPTMAWKRIVSEVNSTPNGGISPHAYQTKTGRWVYRLPVLCTFIGMSHLSLKRRSKLASRQRVIVAPTRIRTSPTQTTTRIRSEVCSKPLT